LFSSGTKRGKTGARQVKIVPDWLKKNSFTAVIGYNKRNEIFNQSQSSASKKPEQHTQTIRQQTIS
jgi:hypothetical protein